MVKLLDRTTNSPFSLLNSQFFTEGRLLEAAPLQKIENEKLRMENGPFHGSKLKQAPGFDKQ
jgi:hypothetical protein